MPPRGGPPATEAKVLHLCASVRGPLGHIVTRRAVQFSQGQDLAREGEGDRASVFDPQPSHRAALGAPLRPPTRRRLASVIVQHERLSLEQKQMKGLALFGATSEGPNR